ncbi:MAG: ribosome-binding factor A [Candidatus Peribacteraceae bacterium]|nr:ribosome-binding factor A [Candidatus Peribacteraceae bacterium]
MAASVIRELIAPVLRDCPQECGIVSITEIEVSSDFAHATVYLSAVHADEKALQYFILRRGDLQKRLAGWSSHHVPMLRFRIDPRSKRGSRIDELLNEETRRQKPSA